MGASDITDVLISENHHTKQSSDDTNESYLPTIQLGPSFRKKKVGNIEQLPTPDAAEIDDCMRLMEKMKELVGKQLGIELDLLLIGFGTTEVEDNQQRYCLFVELKEKRNIPCEQIKSVLEISAESFVRGISGNDAKDMFTKPIPEREKCLVQDTVKEYLLTDGNTRFRQSTHLVCGGTKVELPKKTAPPPKRKAISHDITVDGYVDNLGRSSREVKVRQEEGKPESTKYDVGEYLDSLCERLKIRVLCRFYIQENIDEDGKVTRKLLNFEPIQGSLLESAEPEDDGQEDQGNQSSASPKETNID